MILPAADVPVPGFPLLGPVFFSALAAAPLRSRQIRLFAACPGICRLTGIGCFPLGDCRISIL